MIYSWVQKKFLYFPKIILKYKKTTKHNDSTSKLILPKNNLAKKYTDFDLDVLSSIITIINYLVSLIIYIKL